MPTSVQLANLIPFTTQNAAAMGLRGANASNRVQAGKRMVQPITLDSGTTERLALVAEQIALTRERLNAKDCTDKDRAGLLRGLSLLLDQERKWSGRPDPGTLKPREDRSRRQDITELPDPTPAVNCGSNTPSR
jgi:hypothetical protein